MNHALWLLATLGVIGAFDTLYFHEYRARLPARGPAVAIELRLHATRDFCYALLFGTLPWLEYRGAFAFLLFAVLAAEIVLTLADFGVEDRVRAPFGGVLWAERVTHSVMGIVYGAMLAHMLPDVAAWSEAPTALARTTSAVPAPLRVVLTVMSLGVALSGLRDLASSCGMRRAAWPLHPIRGSLS
ncbi:MAG: hypothetical protein WKG00_11775 [Polyangiaceae bacterium]